MPPPGDLLREELTAALAELRKAAAQHRRRRSQGRGIHAVLCGVLAGVRRMTRLLGWKGG